jgi:hypothetical protein
MQVDVFFRRMNKRHTPATARVDSVHFTMPDDADVLACVQRALDGGAPVGSSWSGIYEIQTDRGIWTRPDARKFFTRGRVFTAAEQTQITFTTWDQLALADN